ncbi:MAG: hypothetical protein JNK49_02920 [Planctomycetes bacterium]|nr:hypothetical protein [Planctomycetota bacterium]
MGRLILHGAFTLLFAAGLGKLIDVSSFVQSMQGWSVLPSMLIPFLAFVLPAFEMWLALRWWSAVGRRQSILMAQILVVAATMAYAFEYCLRPNPPECACFGLWSSYLESVASGKFVLARNLVLLLLISGSALLLDMAESTDCAYAEARKLPGTP